MGQRVTWSLRNRVVVSLRSVTKPQTVGFVQLNRQETGTIYLDFQRTQQPDLIPSDLNFASQISCPKRLACSKYTHPLPFPPQPL